MKSFLLSLLFCAAVSTGSAKPNFVFFLVDDFGWADLGCYGSKFHETPNIDKLAAEGMRFTNAYSACTVCSPSRAAIMTGSYPGRLHLTDWIAGHGQANPKLQIPDWTMKMSHDLVTLPEALKESGYKTQFIGKWHLMPNGQPDMDEHFPESHGFDSNVAGREWGQPKGPGKYFSPFGMPNLDDGKKGDFLTDKLTDEAVKFVEKSKADPFLLYFSYYTVHGPIMARLELKAKYQAKAKMFDNPQGENLDPAYAGMVESLDASVGRVIKAVENAGVADNTVFIFTADNGGDNVKSCGILRGRKGLSYEGGTRVAAIAKWNKKIAAGTSSDVPIIGMDFFPTMLELAGLPALPEAHLDGKSIAPLLTGKATEIDRDTLYWHYPHYHRTLPYGAIRKGDWKLIEFFEDGKLELYDLKNDPGEETDLAATNSEKKDALLKDMQDWRKAVGAQMPIPNPKYDPNKGKQPAKPKKKKAKA
jgi:arylsulfatase A